jgi:hypothetical protein
MADRECLQARLNSTGVTQLGNLTEQLEIIHVRQSRKLKPESLTVDGQKFENSSTHPPPNIKDIFKPTCTPKDFHYHPPLLAK